MASGENLARKAQRAGNRITLPLAFNLRLGDFVRATVKQAKQDQLSVHAGNIAFRGVFAIFPSLLAILWLLHVFGATEIIDVLVRIAGFALTDAATSPIRAQVERVPQDQARGAFTITAVLSILTTLWALAGMFRATMDALNTLYGVEETRPWWKRWGIALLLSLALTVLFVGGAALVVLGAGIARALGDASGSGVIWRWAWTVTLWPVLVLALLTAFAVTYYLAPARTQGFRWIGAGTVIAVALWLIFTLLFSAYLNQVTTYTEIYGALAGIALLMVYVYISCLILLLGAEMNQVIETRLKEGEM